MKNFKNYKKVQAYLGAHPEPIAALEWNKLLQESLSLSMSELEEVKQAMLEDEILICVDQMIYYCDGLHYAKGVFNVVRKDFAFVDSKDLSVYINAKDFNQALDRDEVLISIHHGKKDFGRVIKSLSRKRDYLLGTLKKKSKSLYFQPYESKIYQAVDLDFNGLQVKENDRVIGEIIEVNQRIKVRLISVLGQADEPGMDVLSVLYEYEFETEFNEDVLGEIPKIPQTLKKEDYQGRIDHRDQYVITIDGDDAKDLDDALYMEKLNGGYRLYVHIADVAHYVRPGSSIDQTAYERASSIYMVDRVVPMLPRELSNGICSLHPHVDRLALTCQIDLSERAEVLDYQLYESVIQSKQRLSYSQINRQEDLGLAQTMVEMMLDCAKILQQAATKSGSIDFDSDETEFVIDHQGRVLDVFRAERGPGEAMIESFMVLANEVVAQHVRYLKLPVLYRIHPKPEKDRLQELSHTLRILGYRMKGSLENIHPKSLQKALDFFEGKEEAPVVSRLMLRSMSKAKYHEDPSGHFGLALSDYTHFTSPIRRYPDLLLHQRIKRYLFANDFSNFKEDEKFAHAAGVHVSEVERRILSAERDVEKMKKAQFMEDKINERYIGYVSGVTNFGIFVELDNTVEGLIHVRDMKDDFYHFDAASQKLKGEHSGQVFQLGQKVRVEVVSVDKLENQVNFKLLNRKKNKKKRRKKQHGRRRKKS